MSAQFKNNNLGKQITELDVAPHLGTYTGVEIIVDEKRSYSAGDNSGRVITIQNPWGTKAMAENILASLRGFTYKPYTATGALLDPAAEIGDGVTMRQLYSGLYKITRRYSPLMSAEISAPQDEEIDHEYPYESTQDRQITRKFSAIESEFILQSDKIEAKVSKTSPDGQTSFSWSLLDDRWEVKNGNTTVFKITSSGAEVRGKITATSGAIGGFNIGTSAITYNGLTWNGTKSGIYLGTSGIQLGSANGAYFQASANGTVKAHNMTLTGTLNIGGTNITAANLRSGAQAAYNWNTNGTASGWTTGSGYGFNYNDATQPGTSKYPATFKCGRLDTTGGISCGSLTTGSIKYSGKTLYLGTIKDYYGNDKSVVMYI